MIINVLQANPDEQFTARQLAQKIIDRYSAELASKRQNPRLPVMKISVLAPDNPYTLTRLK